MLFEMKALQSLVSLRMCLILYSQVLWPAMLPLETNVNNTRSV